MIKIDNTNVFGFEAAIRGLRNPYKSWDKSDSEFIVKEEDGVSGVVLSKIGENDLALMNGLAHAGKDHGKFLRMINVTADITAPLYWWKEYDTYKVGTVANSTSTMHKIADKEFELDDFSHDKLNDESEQMLYDLVFYLNGCRDRYLESKNKEDWWQLIQLLPSSYNQLRTVQLNYQVLQSMFHARRGHRLDEWTEFRKWCAELPYFKRICITEFEEDF